MTFRSLLATGAALLTLGTAHAEDVTPAQQAALEAQLKALYSLGGAALSGPTPFTVTPSGDHFDVVAPIRLHGSARGDLRATAAARPGPNGKWSFADVKTAVPFEMVLAMPVPPKDGDKGPLRTIPVTYIVNAASQSGSIEYDPSFATPSSWVTAVTGLTVNTHGSGIEQASVIEGMNGTTTLTPTAGNHADLVMNGGFAGYRLDSKAGPDSPPVVASIDRVTVTGAMTGVDRDRFGQLVQVLTKIGAINKAGPEAAKPLPPALMTELVAALQDIASSMAIAETFDTVKMTVGGMAFALDQVKIGLDGKSEQGLLRAAMDMGFQGLTMPDLGLGELQGLVPRQASLRPFVSGVSMADASKLLAALNEKRDPSPAEMQAVFSHGGVVTGLEALSLDVGGAKFGGEGKLTFSSPAPQDMIGTARLSAENFDALVQKLGAIPMAQQAMPVVIFLKGIGRNEAGRLVWDVSYAGSKLLVNGIDLSAMAGGPPPGGAPKGPAPRQAPNQNRTR